MIPLPTDTVGGMYLNMFKKYHYFKGNLQEKGCFVQTTIVDLEGSQIQHIQKNNAPQVLLF
jgi:hypothetical protein